MADLVALGEPENQWAYLGNLGAAEKIRGIAGGILQGIASLPQRALTAAGDLQRTGEYDPEPVVELASMMVGTPGAPLRSLGSSMRNPLYHGTPANDLRVIEPSTRGPLGPGVYTSPSPQVAKSYAWDNGKVHELPAKDRDIFKGDGHRTDEEWFGFKQDKARLLAAADPDKREAVAAILDKSWSNDGYPLYQRIRHLYGGTDEAAQALFKKAGFEGVSGLVDGPETLLFAAQPLADARAAEGVTAINTVMRKYGLPELAQ
jgi:hypothetical protein